MGGISNMMMLRLSQQVVLFMHILCLRGRPPTNYLCMVRQSSEYLTTLLLVVFAQKTLQHYSRLYPSKMQFYFKKYSLCIFSPLCSSSVHWKAHSGLHILVN